MCVLVLVLVYSCVHVECTAQQLLVLQRLIAYTNINKKTHAHTHTGTVCGSCGAAGELGAVQSFADSQSQFFLLTYSLSQLWLSARKRKRHEIIQKYIFTSVCTHTNENTKAPTCTWKYIYIYICCQMSVFLPVTRSLYVSISLCLCGSIAKFVTSASAGFSFLLFLYRRHRRPISSYLSLCVPLQTALFASATATDNSWQSMKSKSVWQMSAKEMPFKWVRLVYNFHNSSADFLPFLKFSIRICEYVRNRII